MAPSLPVELAALLSPAAYSHPVEQIRLVQTHMSWLLLTGRLTYKIKRPVQYPFVDMRSLERRKFLCEEELRLNRRFAPEIYLDVVPVTRVAGAAHIGGEDGTAIEYAVRMHQFSPDDELANRLEKGSVAPRELAAFGRQLARIHSGLPRVEEGSRYGTFDFVRDILLQNVTQCRYAASRAGLDTDVESLRPRIADLLAEVESLIRTRFEAGHVRECHGDLHCRNVVRQRGELVGFDCLEFEPAFRWIDVAEELAFLWMDLRRRSGSDQATAFLNGYLEASGDYEACRLLRLYGAHRALVRAKVAALEAASAEYGEYVSLARALLDGMHPALILMSGLSGSGKTWLAERLAGPLGAVHLRSDIERKRLPGFADQARYSRDASSKTYDHLRRCAEDVLASSLDVIVDATFQRKADREAFTELARSRDIPVVLVRCRAPDTVLKARIVERAKRADDASEATVDVLKRQQASFEEITEDEQLRVIDADTTRTSIVSDVLGELS